MKVEMKTGNRKTWDKSNGYGELTFQGILDLIKDIRTHQAKSFLDIGSGYGYISRMVRDAVGIKSVGIERDKKRYDACRTVHSYAHRQGHVPAVLEYVNYDIYKHTGYIKNADYIFSNSCLFDKSFPNFVVEHMKPGTVFITNSVYQKPDEQIFLNVTWNKKPHRFNKIIKK